RARARACRSPRSTFPSSRPVSSCASASTSRPDAAGRLWPAAVRCARERALLADHLPGGARLRSLRGVEPRGRYADALAALRRALGAALLGGAAGVAHGISGRIARGLDLELGRAPGGATARAPHRGVGARPRRGGATDQEHRDRRPAFLMRNQPPYTLHVLGASEVVAALDFESTIEALRQMFRGGCDMPVRHHHSIPVPGGRDATLLLMPAWQTGRHGGDKLVTVFPDNVTAAPPAVQGPYPLLGGKTGRPLALMDAPALTARRTAAASALA